MCNKNRTLRVHVNSEIVCNGTYITTSLSPGGKLLVEAGHYSVTGSSNVHAGFAVELTSELKVLVCGIPLNLTLSNTPDGASSELVITKTYPRSNGNDNTAEPGSAYVILRIFSEDGNLMDQAHTSLYAMKAPERLRPET